MVDKCSMIVKLKDNQLQNFMNGPNMWNRLSNQYIPADQLKFTKFDVNAEVKLANSTSIMKTLGAGMDPNVYEGNIY